VKVLTRVGILASIKIPVRIPATFSILVGIPANHKIPARVRVPIRISVSQGVRILQ